MRKVLFSMSICFLSILSTSGEMSSNILISITKSIICDDNMMNLFCRLENNTMFDMYCSGDDLQNALTNIQFYDEKSNPIDKVFFNGCVFYGSPEEIVLPSHAATNLVRSIPFMPVEINKCIRYRISCPLTTTNINGVAGIVFMLAGNGELDIEQEHVPHDFSVESDNFNGRSLVEVKHLLGEEYTLIDEQTIRDSPKIIHNLIKDWGVHGVKDNIYGLLFHRSDGNYYIRVSGKTQDEMKVVEDYFIGNAVEFEKHEPDSTKNPQE